MNRGNNDEGCLGCVVALGIGLMCLPVVGLFMMLCSEDETMKTGGAVLFAIGCIVMFFAMLTGAA